MDERGQRTDNAPARDEIDETLSDEPEVADIEQTGEQDFAIRGAAMSNALPGGASAAAGAVIGSGGDLGLDPHTDDERDDDPSAPASDRDQSARVD